MTKRTAANLAVWTLALAILPGFYSAHADTGTLFLPNNFSTSIGGGSIGPSTFNGKALAFVYCLDIPDEVFVPGTYNNTTVTSTGAVTMTSPDPTDKGTTNAVHQDTVLEDFNDSPVAGKVAWLLDHFAVGAQNGQNTAQAVGLQEAIWTVVFGKNNIYVSIPDPSGVPGVTGAGGTLLTDLDLLAADPNANNTSTTNFLWFSPACKGTCAAGTSPTGTYQALVGYQVPEPSSNLLLGVYLTVGMLGCALAKRKLA